MLAERGPDIEAGPDVRDMNDEGDEPRRLYTGFQKFNEIRIRIDDGNDRQGGHALLLRLFQFVTDTEYVTIGAGRAPRARHICYSMMPRKNRISSKIRIATIVSSRNVPRAIDDCSTANR